MPTQPTGGPQESRIAGALPGLLLALTGMLYVRFYWGGRFVSDGFPLWAIISHWLLVLGVLLSGLGLAWKWSRDVSPFAQKLRRSSALHRMTAFLRSLLPWFIPPLYRPVLLLMLPILITEILYLAVVQYKEGFYFRETLTWVCLTASLIIEIGIFISVVLFFKLIRMRPFAVLVAFLFIACRMIDAVVFYFGQSQIMYYHITMVKGSPFQPFLTAGTLILAGWVVVATAGTAVVLYLRGPQLNRSIWVRWVCFTILFIILAPHYIFYAFNHLIYMGAYTSQFHSIKFERLISVTQNSVYNLYHQLTFDPGYSLMKCVPGAEGFSKAIHAYNLPIGPRHYPPVSEGRPFKRVLLVVVESLSNVLLSPHNPKLEQNNAPHFFSAPEVFSSTFTRYRPSILYTEKGLAMMFTSHPNIYLADSTKYRSSFVHLLRDAGFRTIMIRSDSRFYGEGQVIFPQAGFERIIAREEFVWQGMYRYIKNWWGVCDRIVYEEAIHQLKVHGDEKVFILTLGTDTHVPCGRKNYGDLWYPPYPGMPGIASGPHMLRAMFYADYDLRRLVTRLEEEELWTEETLLIVTGDHAAPLSATWDDVPGYPDNILHPIPLVIITPQKLPYPEDMNMVCCQMDLAPTIVHLLGLPVPEGYWGSSLFAPGAPHNFIGNMEKYGQIWFQGQNDAVERKIDLIQPAGEVEQQLSELFFTLITAGLPVQDNLPAIGGK